MTSPHTHLAPEQLDAYLCGLLTSEEEEAVEAIAEECPICADRLARAGELEVQIRLAFAGLPPGDGDTRPTTGGHVPPDEGIGPNGGDPAPPWPPPPPPPPPPRRLLMGIAVALGAAVLGVLLLPRLLGPGEPAPMPVARVELDVHSNAVLGSDGARPASERIGADCRVTRGALPGDQLTLTVRPNPGAEDASAWFVPRTGAPVRAERKGSAGVLELRWTVPDGTPAGEAGRLWWGRGDTPPNDANAGWESCVVVLGAP